jgi:hypothetical protein
MSFFGGQYEAVTIFEALEPRLLLSAVGAPIMSGADITAKFGDVMFFDPAPDPLLLNSQTASLAGAEAAEFPLDQTFALHSVPGASKVIYLDFDGHTTSGTEWNDEFNGGEDFTTPAFNYEGTSSFSDAEKERIQGIWMRVAEDYAPFDVDVTTEDPGVAALMRSGESDEQWGVRVAIGGNSSDWFAEGAGGVAYLASFAWDSDTPTFVFPENLANGEKYTAEAVSHEAGHTLNLVHDGSDFVEYYAGHGSGATAWAPIMGVGYYSELVQWSKGEYPSANNNEDDLAIITGDNGFGYRTDDHGDSLSLSDALAVDVNSAIFDEGVIEQNVDRDFFSFTTTAGAISLNIAPFHTSPNLDILASLYDSTGVLLTTSNPAESLGANINVSLPAGVYYLAVEGVGQTPLDTGYSDYGSLGYYSIAGYLSGANVTDLSVADLDIDFDIASPDDGDVVTISATIWNLGDFELPDVTVRFYDGDPNSGGVQIDSDYVIASIGAFSSSVTQIAWAPDTAALHDIHVVVDPDDVIIEDVEGNNTAQKSITVSDNDSYGPDIYNVVVTEHNGDGDGIIAADEQARISWELTDSIARGLLITELSTGVTNFVEIQNVWDQVVDASGWTVLLNDPSDISSVNSQAWALDGVIAPGQVLYRTEDPASGTDYLGADIQWENDGPGWVMIIDDAGDIKDFAIWGYSSDQIAGMAIDYGVFSGITVGEQWSGDGAEPGVVLPPPAPPPVGEAITYTGGTYTENFDSMGAGGTTLPSGWIAGEYSPTQTRQPPGSAPVDETLVVDDGSSRSGDASYNYGTTGESDRAIGSRPAKRSGDRATQLAITNDTGAEITELTLAYTGEQWRDSKSKASLPQTLSVWFSTDPGSGFVSMGSQFVFAGPSNAGLNAAIDGNDPANRTEISGVYVPDVSIPDGQTFYITWHDVNDWYQGTSNHALAIDDVSVIPEFEPPKSFLQRSGHRDNDTAIDFVRNNESTMGEENSGLADSSGIGDVELLIDGARVTLDGDYYAIVGPLDSDGSASLEHVFTINVGDGDNSPAYTQHIDSFVVTPIEEITVIHAGLPVVSGQVAPIDFGQVDLDGPVVDIVFEIRNDGGQTLTLGAITAPTGFSVTPPSAESIPSGGSAFFTVTLTTDTGGVFSGDVMLVSSDGAQSPDGLDENPFTFAILGKIGSAASIAKRCVFYNNSAWDAGGDDYAAVAIDKTVLLPGDTPGPVNYTNYSRGINGIIVDVANPTGTLTGEDFSFRINEAANPDTWTSAPDLTVNVQIGGGVGDSDRVTLIWADRAIINQWLEVTVLGGGNTGLAADDVFYIGNAVGQTDGDGDVDAADFSTLKRELGQSGGIGTLNADFDASGRVDLADFAIMRRAFGNSAQAPVFPPTGALAAAAEPMVASPVAASSVKESGVDLLAEFADFGDRVAAGDDAPVDDVAIFTSLVGEIIPAGIYPDSTANVLHRTGVSAEDLRALDDGLFAGQTIELTADILSESALAIRL